jgi:outer membrane lipoprotein-sorting protein
MRQLSALVFIVFCFVSCICAGSESILSLVHRNYGPDASFSTDFTLKIWWQVREKEETKKGSIAMAPGEKFRVVVGNETYVSDGTTCWNHNLKANQVVIRDRAETDLSMLPSRIFAGSLDSSALRVRKQSGQEALLSWTLDTGSSAGRAYSSIGILAERASGRITKCTMTDKNGNTFTYVFTKTIFNKKFSGGAFAFAIPKKARIVDMRK